MSSFPYFNGDAVQRILDYDGCIAAVRTAMCELTAGGIEQPLRAIQILGPGKLFASMPGILSTESGFGAKLVSAFYDPDSTGRSRHRGVVVLFDGQTGEVAGLADAGQVTEIRTAAASAVATHALARPDAARLAVFGCGAQAASHIRAILRVRPITSVAVWGRSPHRAEVFARRMASETGLDIRFSDDPAATAGRADIICTVTSSAGPVLLGEWVKSGTHVNVVGSGWAGPTEIDSALVIKSRYIVDSRRSAMAAAAEFLVAKEAGLINDDHIVAEIGEVLLDRAQGRTSREQVTIYKSLGHVVQDLAAVRYMIAQSNQA